METKWTEGPWEALPQNGAGPMIVHRFDTGNQMQPTGLRLIAHMLERGSSLRQDQANARLIAAAPDLYSIVARFVALAGEWHPDRYAAEEASLMADARAALAKASDGDK